MRGRRIRYLTIGGLGCLLVAVGGPIQTTTRLVLNTTASAPLGFYWLLDTAPAVGDLALVRPPPPLARWMASRGYLPSNVPLIKRVSAVGGQRVCAENHRVLIDERAVAVILKQDRVGRSLPSIAGCRRLTSDEVFLLNTDAPQSLDGRYFGPLPRQTVLGRLHPVWTWER